MTLKAAQGAAAATLEQSELRELLSQHQAAMASAQPFPPLLLLPLHLPRFPLRPALLSSVAFRDGIPQASLVLASSNRPVPR